MPKLREGGATISGFTISDNHWVKLEAAACRKFSPAERSKIKSAAVHFRLSYLSETTWPMLEEAQDKLKKIRLAARVLSGQNVLVAATWPEEKELRTLHQCLGLSGAEYSRFFALQSHLVKLVGATINFQGEIDSLLTALELAIEKLEQEAVPGKRGPQHESSKRNFVRRLTKIFYPNGNLPRIGTRRPKVNSSITSHESKGSAFSDFLYELYCCLPDHPTPPSREAVGDEVNRIVRKMKQQKK